VPLIYTATLQSAIRNHKRAYRRLWHILRDSVRNYRRRLLQCRRNYFKQRNNRGSQTARFRRKLDDFYIRSSVCGRNNFDYDFTVSTSSPITNRMLVDRHHSTYAVSYGQCEATRTSASGVLTLNDVDQYANLSRSISNLRHFEIQTAVPWRGETANQRIFHFGDGTNHMYLTSSNADG
jgi:hypothetical protein